MGLRVGLFDRAAAGIALILHEALVPPVALRSTMIGCTREFGKPAKFMGWIVPIQNMDFYLPAGACKLCSLHPGPGA